MADHILPGDYLLTPRIQRTAHGSDDPEASGRPDRFAATWDQKLASLNQGQKRAYDIVGCAVQVLDEQPSPFPYGSRQNTGPPAKGSRLCASGIHAHEKLGIALLVEMKSDHGFELVELPCEVPHKERLSSARQASQEKRVGGKECGGDVFTVGLGGRRRNEFGRSI